MPTSISGWILLEQSKPPQSAASTPTTPASSSSSLVGFISRWATISNGLIYWYKNEIEIIPEGVGYVRGNVLRPAYTLPNSEVIVQFSIETSSGTVVPISLGINAEEASHWTYMIERSTTINSQRTFSQSDIKTIISSMYFDGDVDDKRFTSSDIEIQLKGKRKGSISITSQDDASKLATSLITQNQLKPDSQQIIEMIMLRAQVKKLQENELRFRSLVSTLRRKVSDSIISDLRASTAESHASMLSDTIERIEPKVQDSIKQIVVLRTVIDDNEKKYKQTLDEKDEVIRKFKEEMGKLNAFLSNKLSVAVAAAGGGAEGRRPIAASVAFKSPSKDTDKSLSELKKDKASLMRQLSSTQAELHKVKQSYRLLNNRKGDKVRKALDDTSIKTSHDDSHSHGDSDRDRMECNALRKQLSTSEDMCHMLQTRCSGYAMNLKSANVALKRCEDNLIASRMQVKSLLDANTGSSSSSSSNGSSSSSSSDTQEQCHRENALLRMRMARMKAELTRLHNDFHGVGTTAITITEAMYNVLSSGSSGNDSIDLVSMSDAIAVLKLKFSDQSKLNDSISSSSSVGNGIGNDDSAVYLDRANSSNDVSASPSKDGAQHMPTMSPDKYYISDGVTTIESLETSALLSSTVIQHRLLHTIYHRYLDHVAGAMNLTRFVRFTKEYGIAGIGHGKVVYGEIDIIFDRAYKYARDDSEVDVIYQQHPKAFGVRAGASETAAKYVSTSPVKQSLITNTNSPKGGLASAHTVTPSQFVYAIKEIACTLYADLIESKLGAALDSLPPKQKTLAEKAVVEVLFCKILLPISRKLDIMPTSLVVVDVELSSICNANSIGTRQLLGSKHDSINRVYSKYTSSHGTMSYKSASKLAHDCNIIPYLIKEQQYYKLFREVALWDAVCGEHVLRRPLPRNIEDIPAAVRATMLNGFIGSSKSSANCASSTSGDSSTVKLELTNANSLMILVCCCATIAYPTTTTTTTTASTAASTDATHVARLSQIFEWMQQTEDFIEVNLPIQ